MAVSKKDVRYVDQALIDLKVQLDNIKTYLDSKSWVNEEDENKLRSAFKFQTDMLKKHLEFTEQFMELAGIMEFYHESQNKKEEKLMEGYSEKPMMGMFKNDEI